MLLELIDDNPLYGKKGTIINDNILKLIPPKHHSLFKERVHDEVSHKFTWRSINLVDLQRDLQRIVDNDRNIPDPIDVEDDPDNEDNPYWDDEEFDEDEDKIEDIPPFF